MNEMKFLLRRISTVVGSGSSGRDEKYIPEPSTNTKKYDRIKIPKQEPWKLQLSKKEDNNNTMNNTVNEYYPQLLSTTQDAKLIFSKIDTSYENKVIIDIKSDLQSDKYPAIPVPYQLNSNTKKATVEHTLEEAEALLNNIETNKSQLVLPMKQLMDIDQDTFKQRLSKNEQMVFSFDASLNKATVDNGYWNTMSKLMNVYVQYQGLKEKISILQNEYKQFVSLREMETSVMNRNNQVAFQPVYHN